MTGIAEKSTILIVDDTPDNLSLLSSLLKGTYRVKVATNGAKALSILNAGTPPDLILLDIMMPDMDGYEVCRRLKADDKTRNIPVMFLTAKSNPEDEIKGFKLGAVDYVTKPISPPRLLERVRTHLELSQVRQGLEQQVQARTVELVAAREVAEKASAVKTRFLSIMSHELRTPLNGIIGYSESLIYEYFGSVGSEQNKEYLQTIRSSGLHLLKLIVNILEMTNLQAGDYKLKREACDLTDLVNKSVETVRERAEASEILINCQLDANLPCLNVDRDAVEQCITNVLSNAVNFSPKSSQVDLFVRKSDDGLTIQVVDAGIGMAEKDIARALDPFVQVERENEVHHEGIGLGLPICKSFMELHGGTVEVESEVGAGTTATMRFPQQCIIATS